MNYALIWPHETLNDLAAAWLASADRDAITEASHLIEQALMSQPLTYGSPRGASVTRMAYEPPLGVEFEIIEDDKKVRMLRVWSLL